MIEKTVWQDEKDLPLTFLLTYNMTWYMEKENNLTIQMRTCLHPQIRCQEKLWFPLQSLDMAPQSCFFVNENGIKVNKENYCKPLKNSYFLQLKNLLSMMTG